MPDTNPTPAPAPAPQDPVASIDTRLDRVIEILDHMNRRDRWRTIGGFIRGAVVVIPTLVIIVSTIYLYLYGADLMQYFSNQASQQVQQSVVEQIMGKLQGSSARSR